MLPGIRQGERDRGARSRRQAAEALGLPAGIPVAVGGQDQKVAALGAGIDLERCTISLGTAMAITQKCDRPVIDPAMRIPCFADLLPGALGPRRLVGLLQHPGLGEAGVLPERRAGTR